MEKGNITILWLDDVRNPDNYFKPTKARLGSIAYNRTCDYYNNNIFNAYTPKFIWVKNFEEFVDYIEENGLPDFVSFDRDLKQDKDGIYCAKWLVNYCRDNGLEMPKHFVHSANRSRYQEFADALSGNDSNNEVLRLNESDISYIIRKVNNILSEGINLGIGNGDEVLCVYHRDVYFPEGLLDKAKAFIRGLRSGSIRYSKHFFNNPFVNNSMATGNSRNHYYEPGVAKGIIRRVIEFGSGEIFEICTNLSGEVVKVGIRTDYDDRDSIVFIIMKIDGGGLVKTVWLNRKNDKHRTLDSGKYVTGPKDTKGYEYWSKLGL